MAGVTGTGYTGGIDVSLPIAMTIAGFFSISIYNVLEINIWIFSTFRRFKGLYFWSIFIASWGIAVHAVGFLLKFFNLSKNEYLNVAIVATGWYAMVTGQSLVLYSRLHLIVRDKRKVRWVLVLILTSFVLFHIPPTILDFGSNSSNPGPFLLPYQIYEKIQVTGFSVQEFIISAFYIWEARMTLLSIATAKKGEAQSVMHHLILVNAIIIVMDLTLMGTIYANQYAIETTYKSLLYSVKLKLEFTILNRLRNLVKSQLKSSCATPVPAFVRYAQPGHDPGVNKTPVVSITTNTSGMTQDENSLLVKSDGTFGRISAA